MAQGGGLVTREQRPVTVTKALVWCRERMQPVGWLGHVDGHPEAPWGGGFARDWSLPGDGERKLMALIGNYTAREVKIAQLVKHTANMPLFVREIRVLSLRQPWAYLMTRGLKTIETRTWGTSYRGTVAIHASQGWSAREAETCRLMAAHGLPLPVPSVIALTKGARAVHFRTGIVGAVELTDCVPMTRFHVLPALSRSLRPSMALGLWAALFPDESPPGEGRTAWLTTNAVRFAEPVPYVGGLGIRGTSYRIGRGAPLEDAAPAIAAAFGTATRRR